MRASDTTYVAEEVEAFLSRENKSGSGLCSLRLLSSFNHVRLASCRPLVRSRPSQAGAARIGAISAVQQSSPGCSFHWNEPIFSRSAVSALHSPPVEYLLEDSGC